MLDPNINSEDPETTGHSVTCRPSLEDPTIVERQHRAVCLRRPYAACNFCPHTIFTLSFKPKEERYELVQCPRWASEQARLNKDQPEKYVDTELATCQQKPFSFCASCPSREKLAALNIDKAKSGWFSRFERFTKDSEDER